MASFAKIAPSAAADGHAQSSSLRDRARRALRSFVRGGSNPRLGDEKDGGDGDLEEDVLDACRVLHQEASLLYHTERVRGALLQDPLKILFSPEPSCEEGVESKGNLARDETENGNSKSSSAQDRASRRRRQILEPLLRKAEVTEFDEAATRDGYVRIGATVRLFAAHSTASEPPKRKKGRSAPSSKDDATQKGRMSASTSEGGRFGELRFCYERTASRTDGAPSSSSSTGGSISSPTYVSYQIEYCGCGDGDGVKGNGAAATSPVGPRRRMLWVNVVAPLGTPSPHGAQPYDPDAEDEDSARWSDAESDNGANGEDSRVSTTSPERKRRKKCNADRQCDGEGKFIPTSSNGVEAPAETGSEADDDPVTKDVFTAGVDGDVLQEFLSELGLDDPVLSEDDSAALFLLLSFPFYEHEWDLVGYVLDAAFGPDGDDTDDD